MDEQLNGYDGQLGPDGKTLRTGIRNDMYSETGIPLQQGAADTPSGGLGNALNGIDLTNLLQQTGVQSQPQVVVEGPTPLDDFNDGVGKLVQQATNFNQGGLATEYMQNIGMPNYLSRAAEMYSKNNEQSAKAFGLYGGVTGGITDTAVAVKLDKLPTEVYNQLQRNYADLLRQDAAQRLNPALQGDGIGQQVLKGINTALEPVAAIGRGIENSTAKLIGLGADVLGLGSQAIGSLIPGQDVFEDFAKSSFDTANEFNKYGGSKYVDVNKSIVDGSPYDWMNPNNFSTTLFNAISLGSELGFDALIAMSTGGGTASANYFGKTTINAMAKQAATALKVGNIGVAKALRKALADATIKDIKTGGGLFLPGIGQLSSSQTVAMLQAGGRGLATALTITPAAVFGTMQLSRGPIPNGFNAFQEGGNEELRKTDFISTADRVAQDILGEAILASGLGVAAGAIKALGTKIVSEGVNLEELKKVLPTLPDSSAASKVIETMVQLRHNAVAQEVYKVADKFNIHTELPQANIGKAVAKWATEAVKPPSTGTFNVGGQAGYHPQVTKLLDDYAGVQKQLVENLKTVKTSQEAEQIIKQAEVEHAQIAELAKAVTSESNGEIKRIAKTRVPSKELSESIDNLVRTNNGGVAPVSIEKANAAATVNMLIKQDTPSTNIATLTEEIKALKVGNKKTPPKNPKLLAQYAKDLETNKSLLKQKQSELKEQKNLQQAKSRSNLLTQIMDKQKEIQEIVEGTRLQVQEGTVKKNLAKAEKIINAHKADPQGLSLSKKLEEAGIPLKPAKKGMNTKNRLYQLTKEDVELFDTNHPDLSTLSIKDKRLLASEELNDLTPLQLKELNNELNRIYDDSDEGGLLGRKLSKLIPDDSIFRPEYTSDSGITTLLPEDMLLSLNKLESQYNELADIDLQLAQTVGISNDALNLQRTVIANQIADSVSKKMGGFELNPKKLVENYNNSLRESVPEEYQYLVPTPEAQKAIVVSGNKQRIVNRIQQTDYYQSLDNTARTEIQKKFRSKGSTPNEAQKFLDDILSGKIKDTPNGETATVKAEKVDSTKGSQTKTDTKTETEETTIQPNTPSEVGDGLDSEYYTNEDVVGVVNNISGGANVKASRSDIDAAVMNIVNNSRKNGLDYESTIHILSQFFEDVNKQMNTQTNFGTYETPNALSRGTISRTADRLGINPNSLIHYINQNVVEDGLQKVYKAEAVAAMANHFDNMLKEALDVAGKADDAEYLQRPHNTFPISGNGGKKAEPGLSPTDNLLDVISRIELFTKVVTPDLQKMVEASGLYASDLNELVKPLQEAKKANALLHNHIPEVAEIDGLLAKAESPSADSITGGRPDDKASVLEDMYNKEEYQSEELVHTNVLKTLIDPKKLAHQQDTFAQVKQQLQEFNSIRRQYVNPLRLQLGLGPGKAIDSAMKAGLNVVMDAVTAVTIGNMVYSTRVMGLQFVGGPMGTLYNLQKYWGANFNTLAANYMYNKTGSNIYRDAGYTQAGAALEAMSEIHASMGDYNTLGGVWYNIVSSFDTLIQAGKWIPKGGHPMTARHSGELEPMFKAASKQFKEGSLGSTALNTMGRFLGTTQKAIATPISFLDSIMTIHTAKVKSRAAVLRDVLLSKEYRDMNFTPGSKESSKYLEMKVDEVMPRNYFVWNKATVEAAQQSTLTTPLPDVSVNKAWHTIKNEGVARAAFGLIDHYSNWISNVAPPLRPHVALFSRVSGNYLNQAFGGTFLSKDGMQLTRAVLPDGTWKVTPYFENYFSKMADTDTYESMAYATGALGGGMIGLLGGWWLVESLDNGKDDFPFIKLLQSSTGAAFNPVTMGYDTTTQIRVDSPLPFGPDGMTINLNQIPALHFILPAVNFYREYTGIMENHSKQLNENVDTSGNVLTALEADQEAQIGRAMQDYLQAVFPIDAAGLNIVDTGKDVVKATMNLHQQATDLHKTLVENKGNEVLYDPWQTIGIGMMPQLVQELFYNSVVTKLIPQLNEIPLINLKADTHSAKDVKIYAGAGLLRTGTGMETMMKFPAVYTFLGQPRITTQSAFAKQNPGATTDPGIRELDRLNKRYPLSKLADSLVFNLHPMGGGSVQPSHTVWGGIMGINGSHIVAAAVRNYILGNNSDPRSALYPYNGKTLPQALRILINSKAYKKAIDVHLDDKKVLGNPDESRERESKVTMVKTLFNVYHERINDLLSSDPSLFVIESSNSKGTSLIPITEVEKNPGVDNRPQGLRTVQPVPQQQIDDFTNKLINNTKSVL